MISLIRDPVPFSTWELPTQSARWCLREAGLSYQRSRSWCPTGAALRKRKSGTVVVTDPDAESKKS